MSISISGDGSITGVQTNYTFDKSLSIAGSALHAVATSGAYADLSGRPTSFSGDYDDLTNKPTLGTAAATATTAYATAAQGTLADSATQPGDLATVATSGSYNDLSDLPSGGAGVIQVKSFTKTSATTYSNISGWDDIGLSVSITPTSASNKILVYCTINGGTPNGHSMTFRVVRGSTAVGVGDASGSRARGFAKMWLQSSNSIHIHNVHTQFLDSPNTTSATTYKAQVNDDGQNWHDFYMNRSYSDANQEAYARVTSNITVMEVTP